MPISSVYLGKGTPPKEYQDLTKAIEDLEKTWTDLDHKESLDAAADLLGLALSLDVSIRLTFHDKDTEITIDPEKNNFTCEDTFTGEQYVLPITHILKEALNPKVKPEVEE